MLWKGPEYETIAMGGSCIGNSDREKIVEFNAICDDLGLDTISTGSVIAYMMEMTEKGLHNFGLKFGETDKALKMVKQIAKKKGLGADAALGVKALSEKFGGRAFAMHVKECNFRDMIHRVRGHGDFLCDRSTRRLPYVRLSSGSRSLGSMTLSLSRVRLNSWPSCKTRNLRSFPWASAVSGPLTANSGTSV